MTDIVEVPTTEVLEIDTTGEVIEIVSQGPRGVQGEPGPAGGSTLTRTASGAIGGHRLVVGNLDGSVSYADAGTASHLGRVLGMTLSAAADGESLDIQRSGPVTMSGWAWDTALPVYLGADGVPTQTPPGSGFVQIVGFAEAPTSLYLDLREPIAIN